MEKEKKEKILKIVVPSVIFLSILMLCLIISKELIYVFKHIINGKTDELKVYMDNLGYEGVFVLILLQALQTLTTVLPGEPIQIIAGIAYGKIGGIAIGVSGIFLGGLILYVLVKRFDKEIIRIFTPKKKQQQEEKLEEKLKNSNRNLIFVILVLYFLPAIPYGFICILAATLGMKFYNFIWVTIVGTLPSVVSCVIIGNQIIKSNYWVSFGVFVFLIAVLIVVIIKKDYIMEKVMYRKYKNHLDYLKKVPIKKPNAFLLGIVKLFIGVFYKRKFNCNFKYLIDIDELKAPFVVINNHGSFYDFIFANYALKKRRMNNVMAYDFFCRKSIGKILISAGCIPKFLFCPDITATKRMIRTIKEGRILGLAPEGRLSASGSIETVNASTVKLLKKLNVSVVNVHIDGGYMTKPKWAKKTRKGRIDITVSKLFDAQQLKTLEDEQLSKMLENALYYNDFEWQDREHVYYKSKNIAQGVDAIIYLCPDCGELFNIKSEKERIYCQNCGMEIKMDNYYQFSSKNAKNMPKNLDEWYKMQKNFEYVNAASDDFCLQSEVVLKMPSANGKKFREVGKGIVELNHEGLRYSGEGEITELFFAIKNIEALPFACKNDFEIYSDEKFYYFAPLKPEISVRFSVVAEQLHRRYKENNIEN